MAFNDSFARVLRKFHHFTRLVQIWFFGDVFYAVLPIVTIALVVSFTSSDFEDFWIAKEWSFANIVFFGSGIRNKIHLKTRIQRTPQSYTLQAGVQVYIVMLILSVMVLAFVVLIEAHALQEFDRVIVRACQLGLFISGVIALWIAALEQEQYEDPDRVARMSFGPFILMRRLLDETQGCMRVMHAILIATSDARRNLTVRDESEWTDFDRAQFPFVTDHLFVNLDAMDKRIRDTKAALTSLRQPPP